MPRLPFLSVILLLLGTAIASTAPTSPQFSDADRAWWAIQPLQDPAIPEPATSHPVDAFLAHQRNEARLSAASQASPEEFIRRAHFDLHGLPPTPTQVDAFRTAWEQDCDQAVETLIDELLASPRYGERWAQHWLDVVRYAESDGYREDAFRPQAYRFRDYVVRSYNQDKPYHQFVREQLAADEFADDDPDTLIATAYLRLGIYEWNQRNAEMQHELMINELTNLTGEAFLGIGIGCAQCHDHKFDPLLQRDYFALQAFLSSTVLPTDQKLGTPDQLQAHADWEDATAEIRAKMEELLAPSARKIAADKVKSFPENVQAMFNKPANERSTYEQQITLLVQRQIDREVDKIDPDKALAKEKEQLARYQELRNQLAEFEAMNPKLPPAFTATDCSPRPAVTHMGSGEEKEEVPPAFLALLDQPAPKITPTESTTGRRRALANWIVRPENPFTARVYVNRIWQHHFGTGLVATPNDFGTLGEPPSHPELLDWLAARFLENDWTTKPLHRLIMTSAAYRQTARREPGEPEKLADPFNRLLWRFPPARLSAEQVRDAMLAVSGELQHRESGGPSAAGNEPVRSIFVKKQRNTPDPVLKAFDSPSGFSSSPERQQTTTPTQALLLANNDWPMARARAFAKRLIGSRREVAPEDVEKAYRLAWGRDATQSEIELALEFIATQAGERQKQRPPAPVAKFPRENGLRPVAQNFGKVHGIDLGSHSLWLQPTSRFERLHLSKLKIESDTFTIEAIVQLDAIHKDASVNTLLSRWNGNHDASGWAFGVTSEKSRYQPRNLIMQLTGTNSGGDLEYEVVASGLRVPQGGPVYLAAAIATATDGQGTVRFYLKELSNPDAKLQTAEVPHNIAGDLQDPGMRPVIGGRDGTPGTHLWDGQLARLAITSGALREEELLLSEPKAGTAKLLEATFDGANPAEPLPGATWLKKPTPPREAPNPHFDALADFCHALLNSNEFLYLH